MFGVEHTDAITLEEMTVKKQMSTQEMAVKKQPQPKSKRDLGHWKV